MIWKTSKTLLKTQERPIVAYFAKAYDFMKAWQEGQSAFVLHTSGSTGTPKPISLSREQLATSAAMTGKALSLGQGTRALVCLNASYIAGLMMLVRGMELDWELTIIEPISNPLSILDRAAFDFVALVPMQLQEILDHADTRDAVDNLGKILLGGAPVNAALQRKIAKVRIPVYASYGMTETVSHVALRQLNGTSASNAFTFLPGISYGVDERGCLFISGPVTNGEVVQTNDLVEIAGDTFTWIGRADNVINSGGVKIVLDKVDAAVAEVFDALHFNNAFFSWSEPDEKLGQKLILIVEGQPEDFGLLNLLEQIRTKVSAYETPKRIYFAKRFARTATDKLDKRTTVQQLFNSSNG
ncbi:AMP-binding protein [Dyadobacter sp. MSC1_007]|jgi:O-succinylbenzoic acid--CoA ligase|uniref:AMP-binding protein n=1 Tax=Dyadobacter sp. MSC1_007 TaxID=2909264 RepID=UPI002030FBDE|nr:AMP-binding protein [Dyadobacter sp. MSC1_007]